MPLGAFRTMLDFLDENPQWRVILDIEPENGEAYFCKLMSKNRVSVREDMKSMESSFENDNDYKKAVRFGDDNLKYELNSYVEFIRKKQIYNRALRIHQESHNTEQLLEAKKDLESIDFRDSAEKAAECYESYEREMQIFSDDKKRVEELVQVFLDIKKTENKLKTVAAELDSIHFDINGSVPAQEELTQAQDEMNRLSQQLRQLSVFKKKEKEDLSYRIVVLGKQISQLKDKIDVQKREVLEAYRENIGTARDEENKLEQKLQQTKRDLYLEAGECEQKKMFGSARCIYEYLGDYNDCNSRLTAVQQEGKQYRGKILL